MKSKVNPIFGLSGGLLSVMCFLLLLPQLGAIFSQETNSDDMPHHEVEHWAQLIGNHIYHLLNTVSKYTEIESNLVKQGATIADNDGLALVKQMAEHVTNMMEYKIQAVKRIMNVAEEVSQDPSYLQEEWKGYFNSKIINRPDEYFESLNELYDSKVYEYYGTKYKDFYRKLDLTTNSHFDGVPVSLNVSTVHVPTNVFEGSPAVKKAIRWSEALEKTFYSNYEHDPSLSWQYFGSSTGFLRQFPGSAWKMDVEDPDLYDARLRSWYIQAANSPKDVIILLDISGSMTGLRKEIAKHVVLNILETLTENDFVNIFKFSDQTEELVGCFNETLVQANLENIGMFKAALDNVTTENIANFSIALKKAFKLLQKYHKMGHGSHCNQAIMLVTDGSPYTHEDIFSEYNWPHLQIRLFSYLIGREVTEIRSLRWMACANKGYFTHVTTPSEVREQVLKYIPVVARPIVMYGSKHPIIWTGVYADIADPKQTNWLWELRERDRQMTRTNNYRKLKQLVESRDFELYKDYMNDKKEVEKFLNYGEFGLSDQRVAQIKAEKARKIRTEFYREFPKKDKWTLVVGRRNKPGARQGYRLMTSVSVPVYNRTKKEKLVADLLGVAGTDIPIREIEKLVPPYKLGVNGYSFMVNNNGYLLYHPDMRPTFQDILKPNYNSVDIAEAELIESDDPRHNDSDLDTLRRDMIDQRNSETNFKVRIHLDNMKRVIIRDQWYYTTKISKTPFSLGLALPRSYGAYKVVGQIELSLAMKDVSKFNATDNFKSETWSIHPDWVYCEYKYDQGVDRSPEELMMHFLIKAQLPGWKWRSTRTRPPPDSTTQSRSHQSQYDQTDYYCDKNLVQSLLFDAKATDVFNNSKAVDFGDIKKEGKHKNFGITNAFVATRSGLSRWIDLGDDHENEHGKTNSVDDDYDMGDSFSHHYMHIHNKAIDEVWYKRAVDYYIEDPDAYVYSVPFDAGTRDPSTVLVTATRAIFIRQNKFQKAPAAVVGVNIKLDKFIEFFQNETYDCREYSKQSSCQKDKTCRSEFLDCYLIDDNGFVVASEKTIDTGKFFGEIEGTIMESLVQSEIYNRIKIFDYQAVCLDNTQGGSFASILLTPYQILKWTANWIMSNIMWVLVKTQIYHMWDPNMAWAYGNYDTEEQPPVLSEQELPPHHESEYETIDNAAEMLLEDGIESIDMLGSEEVSNNSIYETSNANSSDRNISNTIEAEDIDTVNVFRPRHFPGCSSCEDDEDNKNISDYDPAWNEPVEEEEFPKLSLAYINKTRPKPCDKNIYLYNINNSKLRESNTNKYKPIKGKLSNCHSNGCGRPFSVQKVIKTNLVLLVVHNLCPCESRKIALEPTEVIYTSDEHCAILLKRHYRRRPGCSNYHPDETSIKECGGCGRMASPSALVLLTISLLFFAQT